ncbi:MAG: hypothetical protein JEZ07_14490 [Phycisphaerae bacterium]|nr:hypothetical protein [Phycisphaerae bacterium]
MKLWMFLCIAALAVAGPVSAGVVFDVNFGNLAYDADGVQADAQFIPDYSGSGHHGFWGAGSGGAIVEGPNGSTALDSAEANCYAYLRDDRTYNNHGEPYLESPVTTPTPYFVLEADKNYTFEAVLKWDASSLDSRHGIFGQIGSSELWLRENNGAFQYRVDDGPVGVGVSATIDISDLETDGQWHHIAFIVDRTSSEIRFYVDHELVYTNDSETIGTLGAVGNGTSDWRLGAYNTTSSNRFDGGQARYRLCDEVLAPAEFISLNGVSTLLPTDGQQGFGIDEDITWTAGTPAEGAVTSHYVFFGKDPRALTQVATTSVASYDPGTLDKDARYYWRVDEAIDGSAIDDPNTIVGEIFSFETELSLPIVTNNPDDIMVHAGEDAVFTVEATNPLEGDLNYEWIYDPNTNVEGDEVAVSGEGYANADTAELTVLAADLDDEGAYSCIVTNSNGLPVPSNTASLMIKVLLGHWPMDTNLTDTVAGNDGTYTGVGSPLFPAGKIGTGSVDFPTDADTSEDYHANDYAIMLPVDAMNTNSFSISFWTNATATSTQSWETIMGVGTETGYETLGLKIQDQMNWEVRVSNRSGNYPMLASEDIWSYNVVSCDGLTGQWVWYVDGDATGNATGVNFTGFDSDIMLGNIIDGSQPFTGQLDDIKLYNYARTATEVAQAYYDVTGDATCIIYSPMDFNEDCVVDIIDLSTFLSQWLDCNTYPTCLDSAE